MNQTQILKELILSYQLKGGNIADVDSIIVYITAKKPAGVGRVNEVIVRAILKQLGTPAPAQPNKPMIDATPPAIVEEAPVAPVYEKVSIDPITTYDFGEPAMPALAYEQAKQPEQPFKAPEKNESKPESFPAEIAPRAQAPKGFWNKVKAKFWK